MESEDFKKRKVKKIAGFTYYSAVQGTHEGQRLLVEICIGLRFSTSSHNGRISTSEIEEFIVDNARITYDKVN